MSEASSNNALVPSDPAAANAAFLRRFEGGGEADKAPSLRPGVPSFISYVWFKTTNDDLKEAVKAAGGDLPTFVLHRAGYKDPVKPLRFHLFDAQTIATRNDQSGQIIDAEARMPRGEGVGKDWAEHTFAVIGVIKNDIITPAFINLRSGARRALGHAVTATSDAGSPNWAKRGDKFAKTVYHAVTNPTGTQYAPGRVVSVGSVRPEKSPSSGHWMLTGSCSWDVSSAADLARFNAAMNDRQFVLDLEATFNVYAARLRSLLSKEMEAAQDE
jgi:hypothetical protein